MGIGQSAQAEGVRESWSFRRATRRAWRVLGERERVEALLDRAARKARGREDGALAGVWQSLQACLRLLRAYANGSYKGAPWQTLVAIVAALVYFVMPLDVVPDFLAGVGLADDFALLASTLGGVRGDVAAFVEWEGRQAGGST